MTDSMQARLNASLAARGDEPESIVVARLLVAFHNEHWPSQEGAELLSVGMGYLARAYESGDALQIFKLMQGIILAEFRLNRHSDCLRHALELLNWLDSQPEIDIKKEYRLFTVDYIALASFLLADYSVSMEFYQQMHELAKLYGDEKRVAAACNGLGFIMRNQHEYKKSLSHFEEGAAVAEKAEAWEALTIALNETGNNHFYLGDIDQSLHYHKLALEVAQKQHNMRSVAFISHDTGLVYWSMGDKDTALEYLKTAVQYNEEVKDNRNITLSLMNLGQLLGEMKRLDEAQECLDRAYDIAVQSQFPSEQQHALENLAYIYALKDDFRLAYETCIKAMELCESIFTSERTRKIAEMEARFETERRQREAEIYRLRNVELQEANERLQQSLKQLEVAQKEIIELERRASALAMAVTANHEINQPLMVLRGNLEMFLMQNDRTSLNEKQALYVKRIEESLDRIQTILDKFKRFHGVRFSEYSAGTPMVVFERPNETTQNKEE